MVNGNKVSKIKEEKVEILYHQLLNTKRYGKHIKTRKKRLWNNNKREQEFVRIVSNFDITSIY
ncbi:hypothetical protein CR513_49706, partial [Mucuna pruriens]